MPPESTVRKPPHFAARGCSWGLPQRVLEPSPLPLAPPLPPPTLLRWLLPLSLRRSCSDGVLWCCMSKRETESAQSRSVQVGLPSRIRNRESFSVPAVLEQVLRRWRALVLQSRITSRCQACTISFKGRKLPKVAAQVCAAGRNAGHVDYSTESVIIGKG